RVGIVIPALDEEENLRWLLPKLTTTYQVVVVDNGSTDRTASVARELGAAVVSHPAKGYGGAVQAGVAHLILNQPTVDTLCIVDGDGSSPVEALPRLVAPIHAAHADLVI